MNANTMNAVRFFAHTVTVNGQQFPVEYSITPFGVVTAFVTMAGSDKSVDVRIKLDQDHAMYAEAMAAAKQERADRENARSAQAPRELPTKPVADELLDPDTEACTEKQLALIDEFLVERPARAAAVQPVSVPAEAAPQPAAPAMAAQEPAEKPAPAAAPSVLKQRYASQAKPRKEFIGTEIKGRGWVITFDGSYDRTRVIFKRYPSEAAREAVKAAGFYWSPAMKSWNKKLTNKAYMAAQELAIQLRVICR